VLVVLAVTFTVGWRPVIGAKKRPLTSRKFEATPGRMRRGDCLVHAVINCMGCHAKHDEQADPPVLLSKEGAGNVLYDDGKFRLVATNITSDPDTGLASGAMTPSPGPFVKALQQTGERCFRRCLTNASATCPTKTSPPLWFSSAACRRYTAIYLRQEFHLYLPVSFSQYLNR